ncbi:MAG: hypothetical protein ACYDB9_09755 [Gammaproteobacteria bacterium]
MKYEPHQGMIRRLGVMLSAGILFGMLSYPLLVFGQDCSPCSFDGNDTPVGGGQAPVGGVTPPATCAAYCGPSPQEKAAYAARLRQLQNQRKQAVEPKVAPAKQETQQTGETNHQAIQVEKANREAAFKQSQANTLRSMKGLSSDHLKLKSFSNGQGFGQLSLKGYRSQGNTHSLPLDTTVDESSVEYGILDRWFPKVSIQVSSTLQYRLLYRQQQDFVQKYRQIQAHINSLLQSLSKADPAEYGQLQIEMVNAKQARSDIEHQADMVRYQMLNL